MTRPLPAVLAVWLVIYAATEHALCVVREEREALRASVEARIARLVASDDGAKVIALEGEP